MTGARRGGGDAVAVIPARYGSTRLPGKPLLPAAGRPLIEHVYRRVLESERIDRVVVATDDERICAAVRAFGGEALLTDAAHQTGSDRIGELLPTLAAEVIINVQGDEPEIDPALLDSLVDVLREDEEAAVATAACPYPEDADPADPNLVKVVWDTRRRALYFSRAPIPGHKATLPRPDGWPWLHVGVYAYRRSALMRFLTLPQGVLEGIESLEQLRLLENGLSLVVVPWGRAPAGIDTQEEYEAFCRRVEAGGSQVV